MRNVLVTSTRDFKQTVQARVQRDRAFRKKLLKEAVECTLSGNVETGKAVLRTYINATVGFAKLAEATHHSPKSLMRMFGRGGNLQARNLFEVIAFLQRAEGVKFQIRSSKAVA